MPARATTLSSLGVLALVLLLAGCGGGGGGGGASGVAGIGGFGAVSGPGGATILGLNVPISIVFNGKIDPATVQTGSINVVTVEDPAGLATTPGGVLAAFRLEVDGNRIQIIPTVDFDDLSVTFGFVANALFEITFADELSPKVIRSKSGKTMVNSAQSFFFRTEDTIFDRQPGHPDVRAFLVSGVDQVTPPARFEDDNDDGSVVDEALAIFTNPTELPVTGTVPITPIQDLIFIFDEGVIPQSIFNPLDSSSPAVRVLIDTSPGPGAGGSFDPIFAPAILSFFHQQEDVTIVRWEAAFDAFPPAGILLAEVTAQVEDVAGNSKESLTGQATPTLSEPIFVEDLEDNLDYSTIELFADSSQASSGATSARWPEPGDDILTPVLAGGRGRDGPLVVDPDAVLLDSGNTTTPLRSVIDFDAKRVSLPTVSQVGFGEFEPRIWELTRLVIPAGWTLDVLTDRDGDGIPDPAEYLVSSGTHPLDGEGAPLVLRVTGAVDIAGRVSADGVAGSIYAPPETAASPSYADYLGEGGDPGRAVQAAGDGGRGGDVLLPAVSDPSIIAAPLVSPTVDAPGAQFNPADPKLRGVTGRSTTLGATTLHDDDADLSQVDPVAIANGEIRLQPNVGIGSTAPSPAGGPNSGTPNQFIDENHPTFVVESITVGALGSTIEIVSDSGESMTAASGNIGNGYAPLAAAGDCYLIGRLDGGEGEDPALLDRGGVGAEPYVVVNEGAFGIKTTGGGGGGGGGFEPGNRGGDSGPPSDVLTNWRGAVGGGEGVSLDNSAGASGGLGAIRGTGMVVDDDEFDVVSQTAGTPLGPLAGGALIGFRLVPDAPHDGWLFEVEAFDGTTFDVARIVAADLDIGLTTGPAGPDGPGLGVGLEIPFLLVPPADVGGGGGGGSGVSVTGTVNSSPTVLPALTPGAGGGSGGGSLVIETPRRLTLRNEGRITAEGGGGGIVADVQTEFAGGGGGGGGNVTVRAGEGLLLFQDGRISAAGGVGGGSDGRGKGGDGGGGWLRFETFADDLSPAGFSGLTVPPVTEENLGRLIGAPQSVAQSRFYNVGLANPDFREVRIRYHADTDGDGQVDMSGGDKAVYEWAFDGTGASGGAEDFVRPPLTFRFNPTGVDANGFIDVESASPTFYDAYDLVSGRVGLVYDPVGDLLMYSVGEEASQVHLVDTMCLGGTCSVIPFPTIPSVGGDTLNIVSMALDPVSDEIYLLERGTGLVHVVDRVFGAFLRTIRLPQVLEGAMTLVSDGVDPANDRLLIAANRENVLTTFLPRDPMAADPDTTDYAPAAPESMFSVLRDTTFLDIELTGMAYDLATETVWCVDAAAGTLLQVSVAAGSEGLSTSGVHGSARLTAGGDLLLPSAVAFDGSMLHVVHSARRVFPTPSMSGDPESTTVFTVDPADVSLTGGDLALPSLGPALPEIARSMADGKPYLRFRLEIDGTFDDDQHPSGTVSFRRVEIDEVEITARNEAF